MNAERLFSPCSFNTMPSQGTGPAAKGEIVMTFCSFVIRSGIILSLAALIACGGGGDSSPAPAPTPGDTTAPSIPSGVSAVSVFSTEIDIAWSASTDNVGVAGYRVYRDGTQVATVTGGGLRYSNSGLTPNTSYSYRVTAYDTAGNASGQSTPVSQQSLQYSKPLGGSAIEVGNAVAVDSAGNVYVTGQTRGSIGQNQGNQGGYDIFVAKYNSSLALQWVVQYGSAQDDAGQAIAVNANGVYVAGYTNGALPGNTAKGGFDAFVARLNTSDGTLNGSVVQLGSGVDDIAFAIATDSGGNVVVAGYTNGAIPGSLDPNQGDSDIFVSKYTSALGSVAGWPRQTGTASKDGALGVAIDAADNVYVAGYINATDSGGGVYIGHDAYVAKFNSAGVPQQQWSANSGAGQIDIVSAITMDTTGSYLYIAGTTTGTLFGKTNQGGLDVFVAKISTTLPALGATTWNQLVGTAGNEGALAVTADASNNVIVTGTTDSVLFGTSRGDADIFLFSYSADGSVRNWGRQFGTANEDIGYGVAFDRSVTNTGYLTGYVTRSASDTDAGIWKFDTGGNLQ